jgi:hypothetical protein
MEDFPVKEHVTYYWRVCMNSNGGFLVWGIPNTASKNENALDDLGLPP